MVRNLLLPREGAGVIDALVLFVDVVVEIRGHEVWFVAESLVSYPSYPIEFGSEERTSAYPIFIKVLIPAPFTPKSC